MAENECKPDEPISTFVFLDFESTGLPPQLPRITELCLLAVHRQELLSSRTFPRIVNKLTLCLNPQKPVELVASQMTGLDNDSLKLEEPFNAETVQLISMFLKRLKAPVCLVAHNGNRFDFPLLVSELKRVNRSLEHTLLCADSIKAFRVMDKQNPPLKRKHVDSIDHSHKILKPNFDTTSVSAFPSTSGGNNTTLQKRIIPTPESNGGTPSSNRTPSNTRISRSSIPSTSAGNIQQMTTPKEKSKKKSYSLGEIFSRLYGDLPVDAHRAEDDCVTLVKCVQLTKGFLEWVDQNAVLFSTIQPLY